MANSLGSFSEAFQTLPNSIKNLVHRLIQQINPDEIILFGSRARGDHRQNSDYDIAVKAEGIEYANWARLQISLEEQPITLYHVDLVDFSKLDENYRGQITSEGKSLYVR